jgi:hypothetical protein
MTDQREPNTLHVAWRGDHECLALNWWLDEFRRPRLAKLLVRGIDAFA